MRVHHFTLPSIEVVFLALGLIFCHTLRTAYLDSTEELKYE